jgi:hypothetical protein
MPNNRKKKISKETIIPSLSSEKTSTVNKKMSKEEIQELNQKVFDAVNDLELQKSLDKWLKENKQNNQIIKRDLSLLKGMINEYLDSFLLFGYNIEGERIIIQKFEKAKDRDAIMEFLKTIFLKQQHENFLDE